MIDALGPGDDLPATRLLVAAYCDGAEPAELVDLSGQAKSEIAGALAELDPATIAAAFVEMDRRPWAVQWATGSHYEVRRL